MRRLTILSVAYPLAPVRPDTAGGAEQVLAQLDRALVEAGHRSLVVACEGSTPAGTLVATPAETSGLDGIQERAWTRHREAIAAALERWPVDLVHLHGQDFNAYLPLPGVAALVTLHVPASWYAPGALHPTRPNTWLHGVSWTQHRSLPQGPWLLPPIENGVPVDAFQAARHAKRGFALMLARICPEKGIHLAIEAAKRADVSLLIAGEVFGYEAHRRYFEEEVRPRLDARRRLIGPVDFARKRRLLTAARCLLIASVEPETSSLVAREALACGTPVVALANGALPEAVDDGVTGFLVHDVSAMAEAIPRCAALDPEACRQTARERFSLPRTIARYFDLYARLAGRGAASVAGAA